MIDIFKNGKRSVPQNDQRFNHPPYNKAQFIEALEASHDAETIRINTKRPSFGRKMTP